MAHHNIRSPSRFNTSKDERIGKYNPCLYRDLYWVSRVKDGAGGNGLQYGCVGEASSFNGKFNLSRKGPCENSGAPSHNLGTNST